MLGLLLASSQAVAEMTAPDIPAILDHAAIVEEMLRACGHTRPDLAEPLAAAGRDWWSRNASVRDTLAALTRDAERSPEAKSYLAYYEELKARLAREIEDLKAEGNTAFVQNCDDILRKLTVGALDYTGR